MVPSAPSSRPSSRAARSTRRASPTPVEAAYRAAVVRVVLEAARTLCVGRPAGVPPRRLVNFLRGNVFLRPSEEAAAARGGFGALQAHRGDWLEQLVSRMVEAGLLAIVLGTRGPGRGIAATPEGLAALEDRDEIPADVLPVAPRLGAHPAAEAALRSLRRDLAAAEGRSAYGIFPNAVLAAIAEHRPAGLAALSEVPGLGESRIRKYGRRILAALALTKAQTRGRKS